MYATDNKNLNFLRILLIYYVLILAYFLVL